MVARELRYTWMKRLQVEQGYPYLLTAHHLDDRLETLLRHISKGSGIAGLRSILPQQTSIVRPLLSVTKAEILKYAQTEQLSWQEDRSNASLKYERNFIRHQIVPLFYKLNKDWGKTSLRTFARLEATEPIVEDW